MNTTLYLQDTTFAHHEQLLIRHGSLEASTFRFPSGVAALRLKNELGELILLPWQGQQIWSAAFRGRNITMKSMFDEPKPGGPYLQTYGGFLLHCGFTAMGVPAAGDGHPLHGELPNAPYRDAQLLIGSDERGEYLGLTGHYKHTVAFSTNYMAEPLVKLYAGSSVFHVALTVTNLKRTPMEYMYMAHVNFRPVDNGRLVYSAPCTPEHVRVRRSIPSHVKPGPGFAEFLDELVADPAMHNVLSPAWPSTPKWSSSSTMPPIRRAGLTQCRSTPTAAPTTSATSPANSITACAGSAARADQDALGMVLPATAQSEGYSAEKAKGNVKLLGPGAVFHCEMECGVLTEAETRRRWNR